MTKQEYIQSINALMEQTDDEVMLEFIVHLLISTIPEKAAQQLRNAG